MHLEILQSEFHLENEFQNEILKKDLFITVEDSLLKEIILENDRNI